MMTGRHVSRVLNTLITILFLFLATPWSVVAHGGGLPRLVNEPLDDYTISVWINPSPLTVGEVHLTVALAFDESVVLNRDIQVLATPLAGGQTIVSDATHENATNRFFYEADSEISQTGMYQFEVKVDGIEATASFVEEVQDAPRTSNRLTTVFWVGTILIIVQLVRWITKRKRDSAAVQRTN